MDINKFECNGRLLSYRVKSDSNYVLTVLVIRGKHRNKYDIHFRGDVMKDQELKLGKGINIKGRVISHMTRDNDKKLIDVTFLAGEAFTQQSSFSSAFKDGNSAASVSSANYFRGAVSGEIVSKNEGNGYTNIFVRTIGADNRAQSLRLSYRGTMNVELHDRIKATYNAVMRQANSHGREAIVFDGYISEWERETVATPDTGEAKNNDSDGDDPLGIKKDYGLGEGWLDSNREAKAE